MELLDLRLIYNYLRFLTALLTSKFYIMKTKFTLLTILLSLLTITAISQIDGDWENLDPPNDPGERQGHTLVTLPDGRIILFGGQGPDDNLFNDLHIFEQDDWEEIEPINNPPSKRTEHLAWVREDKMFIQGGYGIDGALDDLWFYDYLDNQWSEVINSGPKPPPLHGQAMAQTSNGTVFIVDGTDETGQNIRESWRLISYSFSQLSDCPRNYSNHVMQSVNDEFLFVFGEPGTLIFYNIANDSWGVASNSGPPLSGFSSSTKGLNNDDEVVIFFYGGVDPDGNNSDIVYEFNTVTGEISQREYLLPGNVANGAAAKYFDNSKSNPDDYEILLFGGIVDGEVSNVTWRSTSNLLSVNEIQNNNKYNLQISPNPTSGPITINANRNIDKIGIYNVEGLLMLEQNPHDIEVSINTTSFETGIYFVKVKIENSFVFGRIVIY